MPEPGTQPYRVLARKYRPQTFATLIGQEALVRTLTNAIRSGRLAHAFMLTGVRGVGKTTTARIIARALNCVGPDGSGGPTPEPCGICEPCRAIAEDRHVDVMELDAASRTGVDDVREIIDGVRYKPVAARFKIYIIDEVHMLSKNAFNALLKTLEEPPEHTKFVFATTEIRKVPVTVLSRCQRFDLRRVETAVLAEHFTGVARTEGVEIEPAAAELIARAADGSVRDGLSLLDQAIALGDGPDATGPVTAEPVRRMLGLADRALVFDLFELLVRGDVAAALGQYGEMHRSGVDPLAVVQDLLGFCHHLTRLKVAPDADAGTLSDLAQARARGMAEKLGVGQLSRLWQMLLKGVGEVQQAPDGRAALEMVMIRLAHVADLPTPGELVRQLADRGGAPPAPQPAPTTPGPGTRQLRAGGGEVIAAPQPVAASALPDPQSFEEVVALFGDRREGVLRSQLVANVRLVHFEPGRLEIRPTEQAPRDLANRVGDLLSTWTGRRWVVSVAGSGGAATLREQAEETARRQLAEAAAHPLVRAVLDAFPGASIEAIRPLKPDLEPAADPDETPDEPG